MICEIPPAIFGLLLTAMLILCFAEMFCVIAMVLQHRGIWQTISAGILLIGGFTLFQLTVNTAQVPGALLPAWSLKNKAILYISFLLLAGLTIWEFFTVVQWEKENWSPNTVRESFNQLPTGICFSDLNGSVLLSNHKMEEICLAASGKPLLDANAFWDTVGSQGFVTLGSGVTWNLERRILSTQIGDVYQITAADVTRKHAIMQELKKDQQQLQQIQARLLQYSESVTELTREKEILAAKIRVHDSLGECLLAAKRCIVTSAGRKEKEEVLKMWRQNLTLLAVPPDHEKSDSLGELLSAAKTVGVRVLLTGPVPPAGSIARALTEAAIHTCVTNTVRHAHGSELYVEMIKDGTHWTCRCTNNGCVPDGPVREGGGLTTLRRKTEREGGTMIVESSPRFALTLAVEEGGLS